MRVVRGALAVVAVVATAGCAVGSSSSPAADAGALLDPVEQASSAVATSETTVDLLGQDRLSRTVADTALLDQNAVLEDAAFAVSTLVPTDSMTAAWQVEALAAVRDAQAAVVGARAWANDARPGQDAVRARLGDSADRLDALTTRLEDAS